MVSRRELVAAALLLALAGIVLWPYRHFSGDDAYITFRFARNLAEHHGFAFNPDEPTYGSTSPLWTGLIAAGCRLGMSPPEGAHLLNAACVAFIVPTFLRLTREFIRSFGLRVLAAVLLIVDPWFVHWAMSGMENSLAIALLCGVLLARYGLRGHRGVWLAGGLCGLGLLTRPEFGLLTVLVGFDILVFEESQRVRKAVVCASIAAAIVAPWLVYAHEHFGTIVPNTVTAKLGPNRLASLELTARYFASFYPFEALGLGLLVAFANRRIIDRLRARSLRARWFLPVAWSLALPLFYIVGGAPVAGRYLVLGLPAFVVVGVKGWELLCEGFVWRRFGRGAVTALAALTVLLDAYVQAHYGWYVTAWPQGMDPAMIALGERLHETTAPTDLVATDQVGVIGYYANCRVLDLVGLVSPEMQAPRRAGEKAMLQATRDRSPQWLVLLDDVPHLEALVPDYASLELVATYEVQREGAQAAGHKLLYKLYRSHWGKPG